MQTKIEGLLISKIPYQDRHVIGHLLLRSGRKVSVLFYGGRGGGKKQKSSTLELGHMLKVELRPSKKTSDLHYGKEWTPVWMHEKIRLDYKAFSLMCLFLESIGKIIVEDNLHDPLMHEDQSFEGLFRVLSNALFLMEKSLSSNEKFIPQEQLLIFIGKLLIEQGVFPEREHCVLSGAELESEMDMVLVAEQGGFVSSQCVNQEERRMLGDGAAGVELWRHLGIIGHSKYSDMQELGLQNTPIVRSLFQYFCYQFQFEEKDFKSLSMVL
jgi:DNA repair protein RecO